MMRPVWSPEDFLQMAEDMRRIQAEQEHIAPVIDLATRERIS